MKDVLAVLAFLAIFALTIWQDKRAGVRRLAFAGRVRSTIEVGP